jgi:hypothetical protein
MSEPPFWPETAEGWSTLISNTIAIMTFVFGRRAFLGYLVSLRRALEALRFAVPSGASPQDVRLQHVNIKIERPEGSGLWVVHWTVADGKDPTKAIATITSARLRWHLYWNKRERDLPVFGEVRFLDAAEGPQMVEIPSVDHIARGGIPGPLARILFG